MSRILVIVLFACILRVDSGPMQGFQAHSEASTDAPLPLLHSLPNIGGVPPVPPPQNVSCTCICADINESCLCISFKTNTVHNVQCSTEFDRILVDENTTYSNNNQSSLQDLQDFILLHPELQYLNTNLLSDGIFSFASEFLKSYLSLLPRGHAKNFVFSPLSIHAVLSILTSASTTDSQTQIELLNSLGSLNNINSLESLYKMLFEDYSRMGHALKIANGLWSPPSLEFSVNKSFIEHAHEIYTSSYEFVNPSEAKDAINEWVQNRTHGKIKSLFDEVSNDFVLILANVIYFKDSWTIEFEEPIDEEDNFFTLEDGTRVRTDMMERESIEFKYGMFDFGRVKNIKVVTIPYESMNRRFEMVLIVPEDHKGLSYIHYELLFLEQGIETIFQTALGSITDADYEYSLESPKVIMPEFLLDTKLNVNEILLALGVKTIFNEASLDKIATDVPLKVSQVQHKAILEVNKQGTEGAAATGIEVVPLIGGLDEPPSIKANVPFLFFVYDTERKVPLFMGQVADPRKESETPFQ